MKYNRKLLNAVRRETLKSPADIIKAQQHREAVAGTASFIADQRNQPRVEVRYRHLREKYVTEDIIMERSRDLFVKYAEYGATWAACVQAVKTDYVPAFSNKWLQQASKKKN